MTRKLSKHHWNRKFAQELKRRLGESYPIPSDDWSTADYCRVNGQEPIDAAIDLANNRLLAVPERVHCKAWIDDNGDFCCGPDVPDDVRIEIQKAVNDGQKVGHVRHWANAFPQFRHLQDVRPVLYLWELL